MTTTQTLAQREFEILEQTVPDALILPFKKEILDLCEAFYQSGQSGGSAPYTASAISQVVHSLMLHHPITGITGDDEEWNNVSDINDGESMYQNRRCSAVFKSDTEPAYYLDAIIWQGEEDWDTFIGRVYLDESFTELVQSRQTVKFPFKPKSFYINVRRIPVDKSIAEEKGLHYIENSPDDCYLTVIKDPKQMDGVFEYYTRKSL